MPALVTHYLMAQESLEQASISFDTIEENKAFLLGAQGPDPYFFRILSVTPQTAHAYAKSTHYHKTAKQYRALFEALKLVRDEDEAVAKAYAMGFLAHFTLDSMAHPYVYANQFAIMDSSDELKGAPNQVHAIIESDIDSSLLKRLRGYEISQAYILSCLDLSDSSLTTIGRLHSFIAHKVYNIDLEYKEFEHAVKDMRTIYRFIEGDKSVGFKVLSGLEEKINKHSMLMSLSHRKAGELSDRHLNLDHETWTHPFINKKLNLSFEDIFEQAVYAYVTKLKTFLSGQNFFELSGHLNYSGQLLDEDELYPLVHLKYE